MMLGKLPIFRNVDFSRRGPNLQVQFTATSSGESKRLLTKSEPKVRVGVPRCPSTRAEEHPMCSSYRMSLQGSGSWKSYNELARSEEMAPVEKGRLNLLTDLGPWMMES